MAIFLCDMSHTNNGDGADWTDSTPVGGAFNSIVSALASAGAGDTIYVRGTGTESTSLVTLIGPTCPTQPVKVIGVKSGTTNTTPIQGDLIIGEGTGASAGTRAYNNSPPLIKITGAGIDLRYKEQLYFYGIKFEIGGQMVSGGSANVDTQAEFEECEFAWGLETAADTMRIGNINTTDNNLFKRCKFTFPGTSSRIDETFGNMSHYIDCIFVGPNPSVLFSGAGDGSGMTFIYGCDMTGGDNAVTNFIDNVNNGQTRIIGCKTDSGGEGLGVTQGGFPALAFEHQVGPDPGSPLGTGDSAQDFISYIWNGDVLTETTVIRTGGANDGASGAFSWAATPHSGQSIERFSPFILPELEGWVKGDGTAKTVTVYITNDNSIVFADDDVGIEVFYPSEDGNIKGGFKETRMPILNTPSAIASDAASTWGGSGTEDDDAQKITISISPNFSGPVRVRVNYWKAGTDTLFIDPKLYIT